MATVREAVYMVLDQLKITSDDANFTETHVMFMLNKNRALLLKQRYSKKDKAVSTSNLQNFKFKVVGNVSVGKTIVNTVPPGCPPGDITTYRDWLAIALPFYNLEDQGKGVEELLAIVDNPPIVYKCDTGEGFTAEELYEDFIRIGITDCEYISSVIDLKKHYGGYLGIKSETPIPSIMNIYQPNIYDDNYSLDYEYIPFNRFMYVGYKPFNWSTIYCSKDNEDYMLFKYSEKKLQKIGSITSDFDLTMRAVFVDMFSVLPIVAGEKYPKLQDMLDMELPVEDILLQPLIDMTVKELSVGLMMPEDNINNGKDDISDLNQFVRNNMKQTVKKD